MDLFFLGLGLVFLSGALACAPPPVVDEGGIPDLTETLCEVLQEEDLGETGGAFACRGSWEDVNGELFGAIKRKKGESFELLKVGRDGRVLAQVASAHGGEKVRLVGVQGGVLSLSFTSSEVRFAVHSRELEARAELQSLRSAQKKAVFYDVEGVELGEGALLAASTGFGVEVWRVSAEGSVLEHKSILKHPEMSYCRDVTLEASPEGVLATLQCREVVPLKPSVRRDFVDVANFDYDAIEPERSRLRVWLDGAGELLKADLVADADKDPAPPRYKERRVVEDQHPRPREHRVRALDAWVVGEERYLSLVCEGADGVAGKARVTVLDCVSEEEELPEIEGERAERW